jgi:hypothetical protein
MEAKGKLTIGSFKKQLKGVKIVTHLQPAGKSSLKIKKDPVQVQDQYPSKYFRPRLDLQGLKQKVLQMHVQQTSLTQPT